MEAGDFCKLKAKRYGFTVNCKKLAVEVSGLIQEKHGLLDKHSFADKELIRKAEISKQEVNGLKQKMTFIHTEILADQPVNDSENHIETENCSAILGEDITDDDSVEQDMTSDSENEHIESHLTEQIPLKSEGTQFGSEIGTHPQEVPMMTEVYQGHDMMPCR
ncbi:putative cTAGE family member 3 [Ochotona princeps]|uniref:putative cTAGE family member 3 n=1 Tax=Ochotona princeps TaxID=9978 RepID=UPI00271476DF|nr:putative cTAGE family member 3 [Ochotona princeps]